MENDGNDAFALYDSSVVEYRGALMLPLLKAHALLLALRRGAGQAGKMTSTCA